MGDESMGNIDESIPPKKLTESTDIDLVESVQSGASIESVPSTVSIPEISEMAEIPVIQPPPPSIPKRKRMIPPKPPKKPHKESISMQRTLPVGSHTIPLKPASYCRPSVWNQVGTVEDTSIMQTDPSKMDSNPEEWYLDEERFSFELMAQNVVIPPMHSQYRNEEKMERQISREHTFSQIVGDHTLGQEMVMADIVADIVD